MPEYLTGICLLHADVGPVQPGNYAQNRNRPRPKAAAVAAGGAAVARNLLGKEAERVLRRVERNFTALTCIVPMAEIEDLSPSIQPPVVGAPWT
jgi:hypothetical protein